MSLQHAAKYIAKHGRGNDTMLVHMTPSEVGGLQALAKAQGGSLSINPNTGLPEASFLSKLMPTILGGAAVALTGGAITPLMAGLGVGGLEALRSGDIKKGITAGLGAYGGAGLAGGLAGAASASPEVAAQALGTPAATGAGSQASMLAAQNAGFGQAGIQGLADSAAVAQGATPVVPSALGTMTAGAENLATQGGRAGFMQGVGGLGGLAQYGLAAASPFMQSEPAQLPQQADNSPNPYRYRFERGEASPFPEPSSTGVERSYFPGARYVAYADGGPIDGAASPSVFGENTNFPTVGMPAMPYQRTAAQGTPTGLNNSVFDPSTGAQRLAQGGLSDLGGYSDGGRLLRGPGDGVSDSIPAVIGEKQPARLADGEFVVPARIVSELGNGSTEAGARKLYAMMDRVQKARSKTVGKGNIAKNTRSDKHLPA